VLENFAFQPIKIAIQAGAYNLFLTTNNNRLRKILTMFVNKDIRRTHISFYAAPDPVTNDSSKSKYEKKSKQQIGAVKNRPISNEDFVDNNGNKNNQASKFDRLLR